METQPRSATRPARGFTQRLKEDGRRTLEQRKRSAAERVGEIAQAIERTGAQFSENEPTLADARQPARRLPSAILRHGCAKAASTISSTTRARSRAAILVCSSPAASLPVSCSRDS